MACSSVLKLVLPDMPCYIPNELVKMLLHKAAQIEAVMIYPTSLWKIGDKHGLLKCRIGDLT